MPRHAMPCHAMPCRTSRAAALPRGASRICLRLREAAVRYSRTRLHASVLPAPLSPEMSTDWSTKAPSAAASILASSESASVASKAFEGMRWRCDGDVMEM